VSCSCCVLFPYSLSSRPVIFRLPWRPVLFENSSTSPLLRSVASHSNSPFRNVYLHLIPHSRYFSDASICIGYVLMPIGCMPLSFPTSSNSFLPFIHSTTSNTTLRKISAAPYDALCVLSGMMRKSCVLSSVTAVKSNFVKTSNEAHC